MNCSILATCAASGAGANGAVNAATPATGLESQRAERFAQMLEQEPSRENVYVSAPEVSASANNPVVVVLSTFQSLEFPISSRIEQASTDKPDSKESDEFDKLLQAQEQLMHNAMMLEVVNAAKQGVSTLFQQQG